MDRKREHISTDHLDDFILKHYEDHSIIPTLELWSQLGDRLDHNLKQKKIRRNNQIKAVGTSLGVIIIGSLIYLSVFFNHNVIEGGSEDTAIPSKASDPMVSKSSPESSSEIGLQQSRVEQTSSVKESAKEILTKTAVESGLNETGQSNMAGKVLADAQESSNKTGQISVLPPGYETIPTVSLDQIALPPDVSLGETTTPDMKNLGGMNPLEISLPDSSLQEPVGVKRIEQVKRTFFLEGFIGPEVSYRGLLNNPSFEGIPVEKSYFNQSERAAITYIAGAMGGVVYSRALTFKTGIFFSRYSLNFKTQTFNLKHDVDGNHFIYTSPGISQLNITSSDSIPAETFMKSQLDFSYVNVPLIAEIRITQNLAFDLGMNMNYLYGQNLNWESENEDLNNGFDSNQEIQNLNKFNVSAILGIQYQRPIQHNLYWYIAPTFRIYLKSINNNMPVLSFPYAWGFNAGLRYYF